MPGIRGIREAITMMKPITTKTGAVLLAMAAFAATASCALAQSTSLDGSWSGGGKLTLPSGATESARCRVSYSRESKSSYSANASCATASGRVNQTANLRQTGANSYSGSFHNPEYGISGSIQVTVSGSSQSVSLNGGGASASLRLSR
jgi:uncharacterized protein (DUF2147 family)